MQIYIYGFWLASVPANEQRASPQPQAACKLRDARGLHMPAPSDGANDRLSKTFAALRNLLRRIFRGRFPEAFREYSSFLWLWPHGSKESIYYFNMESDVLKTTHVRYPLVTSFVNGAGQSGHPHWRDARSMPSRNQTCVHAREVTILPSISFRAVEQTDGRHHNTRGYKQTGWHRMVGSRRTL